MKKIFTIMLLALACTATLHAQKKTFIRDYTYQASELDSKVSARANATNEMRNILLSEVGQYLHVERILMQDDTSEAFSQKIEAITAGIVEMKPLDEQWDGATYYIKAEMVVDPDEVNRRIAEIRNDKQRTRELEDARKRTRGMELEIMRLQTALAEQKKLGGNATAASAQALQTAYLAQISRLSVEEYFIKGEYAFEKKEYDDAIDYYLKAVELDPENATAYGKMAYAYDQKYRRSGKGDNKKDDRYAAMARKHYLKALELDPNNFTALYGIIHRHWNGDYDLYFSCARKLIALEPDNVALRKKIILGILDSDLNVAQKKQVITWCEELIATTTELNYGAFAYVTMFDIYNACKTCQDDSYAQNQKAFEAYKHQFRLKLAREGNTKMRDWFRAQGISWIE
jgi:tetratricopeptide (TPR) repeat protein